MKNKIGLLGGMGPESTLIYYKEINRLFMEGSQTKQFPEFVIESVDVWKMLELESKEETIPELIQYLLERIEHLKLCGCNIAAFTAVTPHLVFNKVQALSPLPLISVVECGSQYASQKGYSKVALLGTRFTMDNTFVQDVFQQSGIDVITPKVEEKVYIHQKLCDEIELGIIKEGTIEHFKQIADRLIQEEKVEAIILGCTELPLIFEYIDLPVEKLDMMKIHIDVLVDKMLEK